MTSLALGAETTCSSGSATTPATKTAPSTQRNGRKTPCRRKNSLALTVTGDCPKDHFESQLGCDGAWQTGIFIPVLNFTFHMLPREALACPPSSRRRLRARQQPLHPCLRNPARRMAFGDGARHADLASAAAIRSLAAHSSGLLRVRSRKRKHEECNSPVSFQRDTLLTLVAPEQILGYRVSNVG